MSRMFAFLNALEEAGEVMPDEHRGVAAVSVAGDIDPRAGAHRHRCRRCNAAAGEGCSESARDPITSARVPLGLASHLGAADDSPAG